MEGAPVIRTEAAELGAAEGDIGEQLERAEEGRLAVHQERSAAQQAEPAPDRSAVGVGAGLQAERPPDGGNVAARNAVLPRRAIFLIEEVSRKG